MYVIKWEKYFFLLFLSPSLCFIDSFSQIEVVSLQLPLGSKLMSGSCTLHPVPLFMGRLLPFLSDPPALAWASEPDAVVIFFEGCFFCSESSVVRTSIGRSLAPAVYYYYHSTGPVGRNGIRLQVQRELSRN